jgi:transposase-like protein
MAPKDVAAAKLLPAMGEALRKRRHGTGRRSGQSWYVDKTYLKVHGRWCYLYRAIDRDGNLIDTMLSATRDMRAAQREFRLGSRLCPSVVTRSGTKPDQARNGPCRTEEPG